MRRRLVIAILVLAALWPLAHRVTVLRFDLNPWKLAGFAMYATPAPPVLVALLYPVPGGFRSLDRHTLSPSLKRQLEIFEMERHALGTLRRPDDLGHAVLRERRELSSLIIMVQRMKLDPDTARMTSRHDRYVYDQTALD